MQPKYFGLLIYNVTYNIDREAHGDWLKFIERDYLPVLMESNTVERYSFTRLLGVDETDSLTYCLLLTFSSRPAFDVYQQKFALDHAKMLESVMKDRYVSFPSMLDVVLSGS